MYLANTLPLLANMTEILEEMHNEIKTCVRQTTEKVLSLKEKLYQKSS